MAEVFLSINSGYSILSCFEHWITLGRLNQSEINFCRVFFFLTKSAKIELHGPKRKFFFKNEEIFFFLTGETG